VLLGPRLAVGQAAAAFLPFHCQGWLLTTAEDKVVDAEAMVCLCLVRDLATILPMVLIAPELVVVALGAIVTKTLAPGLGRKSLS
jgi:hypothetical protein